MQKLKFHDQLSMPQLGYGVWQVEDQVAAKVVKEAIQTGYRSIDTAAIYNNEVGTGIGIQESGVPRHELYVTTKVWNADHGTDSVIRAMELSLKKLKLDYVDLYLIHWPAPKKDLYLDTWKAMIKIKESGLAKSIGVSNFQISHLERIIQETSVVPVVNQIELHPVFQQRELKAFHQKHNILTEAWSPLGQGSLFENPTIVELAKKYNKSAAQIILRWHMQDGNIAIPKSVTPSRIKDNFHIFDFVLSADDMKKMYALDDKEGRVGPNPDTADF